MALPRASHEAAGVGTQHPASLLGELCILGGEALNLSLQDTADQ